MLATSHNLLSERQGFSPVTVNLVSRQTRAAAIEKLPHSESYT